MATPPSPRALGAHIVRCRLALGFILVASALVRIGLVLAGGRFFFSDEGRYLRGHHLFLFLLKGDLAGAKSMLEHSDSIGFDVVSLATTALQHAFAGLTSPDDWSASLARLNEGTVLGAILLAMAPVVAIGLVYLVARRLGAGEGEALGAAFLLSLSNTAFYFSRHLVPYDTAIAVALGAAWVALGKPGVKYSIAAGLLAGATFHLYNGYWFLVPVVIAVRWAHSGLFRAGWSSAAVTALAAVVIISLRYALGYWVYGADFLESTVTYQRSVTLGLYREGWSLPWEYLFHAEGAFGILLIALSLGRACWPGSAPLPGRVRGVLWCVLGIYLMWVAVSTVGHVFVMYGRTVKPLVPVLCLLGGWALAAGWRFHARRGWIAATAFFGLGVMNLLPNFWLIYPREFETAVAAKFGLVKRSASVSGGLFFPTTLVATAPDYLMVNGQYLFPLRSIVAIPAGETVLSAAHALQHLPYQYEGFTPRQRHILRTADIRMRLIHLADPSATSDLPPAALRATADDWPDGFGSEAEMAAAPAPRVPAP